MLLPPRTVSEYRCSPKFLLKQNPTPDSKSQAMPEHFDYILDSLGPSRPAIHKPPPTSNSKQKPREIRPKGSVSTVHQISSTESRRKRHAVTQKEQRDRINVALKRMAQVMESGGLRGTSGTKADLIFSAVEYIQTLQQQVKELRRNGITPTFVG
ncbi:hypothetical protein ASPCAL10859 [Aspergillus calidoustus]|uniref:BHLH domain-containing protein n=1 Tax=Aspergillus calidoustus TaxID=454130 RepID=A0A0U5GB95_ASPCI|nr:hypothetical protein ASPCAL10859 [Aspergillus calidoustus]